MPLIKANLKADFKAIADDPPTSHADAANAWADAIVNYASGVIPASTTVSAGRSALVSAFTTAFASSAAAPSMETAMTAFGATVGGGMAPAFVAVPPAGPVGFAALWTGTTDDTDAAADDLASAIDTWMKTGTATPSAGGPPVNWS